MMMFHNLILPLFSAATVLAALNEPCLGANNDPGVCVTESNCDAAGGTTITGACPMDPADVLCCTKPSCDNGDDGNCRWVSDCAGDTVVGECPGPEAMMCCDSAEDGFGGYPEPDLPELGACQQVSIDGAEMVNEQFPGYTWQYWCAVDCECGGPDGDHCCGLAIDWMISDDGGEPTMAGMAMAEWIMENRSALNLKYVIWGQRIWNPDQDEEMPWTDWRSQEDRGDITQNHWDHVHASFNG